jgi:hypothetical protein
VKDHLESQPIPRHHILMVVAVVLVVLLVLLEVLVL